MSALVEIAVVILLVLLNGVFAMGELAVVSARRGRLMAMQKAGVKGASTALKLAENPERMLPTVQIGITLVGILAGAFGGARLSATLSPAVARIPVLAPYADDIAFGVVVLIITYLSLILGELVPKTFALRNPEGVACKLAALLLLLSKVAAPAVWLLSSSSSLVLRLVGASKQVEATVTEEEVKAVVAEGAEAGALETEERHMIERVLRLADKPVRALMTPRPEVFWLDKDDPAEVIAARLREQNANRYVVGDGRVDNPIGVVATKDLLDRILAGEPLSLTDTMRQPMVLPDNLPALDALERMRHDRLGMALVMDEYGSFEGIVTASDLLEAIVGELGGEEAPEPGAAVERHDGSLLIDGTMPSDELKARLDLPSLPQEGTYHTVAGLVLALLQRVPREGDRIAWSGWQFEVMDMDGRRVDKVLVSNEPMAG
ncbi:hemolysin family protein [Roseomonas elaeocarpi]|uniref:Hemolysin family protein n=1 Tax=Roseomonas elaeocarpi TaxID=907779 RepID=A0ABV6K1L7_9PROT